MPRRIMEGTVVSTKQDKTATVRVVRRISDPLYGKFVNKSVKFAAHDENNSCKEGDIVRIEECRPISKRKTWRVILDGDASASEQKAEVKKSAAKKNTAKKTTKKKDEA